LQWDGATFGPNLETSDFRMNLWHGVRRLSLVLCGLSGSLVAQELSVLGGWAGERVFGDSTYTFKLDYRQHLARNLAASVAYINEGHVPAHHRDGNAGQVWAIVPFGPRFNLSAGAGAYFFYDTQSQPNGDSADLHGTAPTPNSQKNGDRAHASAAMEI
jgi:hypothetical protein